MMTLEDWLCGLKSQVYHSNCFYEDSHSHQLEPVVLQNSALVKQHSSVVPPCKMQACNKTCLASFSFCLVLVLVCFVDATVILCLSSLTGA